MNQINMPRLSDSMEEGMILKWLVEPGAQVAAGDDLAEIETDKATMTYQSEVAGMLEVIAAEGDAVAVGEPIARLLAGGDSPVSAPPDTRESPGPEDAPAAEPSPPVTAPPTVAVAAGNGRHAHDRSVSATPLARRIARRRNVDLSGLTGSGPRGRVTKADVLAAVGEAAPLPRQVELTARAAGIESPVAATEGAKGESTLRPMTRLQQVIARRMSEVKATVPDFQVETEVTMDAAITLRGRLKEIATGGQVPSFNDLIVKAAAMALRKHPRANATYREDGFELYSRVNVGIAVAADEALVVPTVFDADTKSLGEIGRDSRRLAERVRNKGITPPELAGATFTVSNLGMFGTTGVTPIINRNQAAILGVGTMRETLRRIDGEIVDATTMTLRLSADHRILYGAEAAQFLATIKELLEEPLLLAL